MRRTETLFVLALGFCLAACTSEDSGEGTPSASTVAGSTNGTRVVEEPQPVPTPAAKAADARASPTAADARQLVVDYYAALNARDYQKAYAMWEDGGAASGQSFQHFSGGYANTESVEADVGAATNEEGTAGSRYIRVPVTLRAPQYNGAQRSYRGRFELRAVVADGASEGQRRWHLHSAEMQRLGDADNDADQ
ncbi:MAG: hypothetical protein ABIO17_04010 [Pseudoxanthomonas sp.]